jgi:uncharacterized protein involved in response to NO
MALEEPYRMFFPMGMLAGAWGVMMWPLFYGGYLGFYPNEAHARIMIEGFMGAFVPGFIGTAFPRLTGNRPWSRGEFGVLLLLWALTVASHSFGKVQAGDMAFCGLLVALLAGMATRWISGRRDTPPPGFLLVFAGVAGAAASAGWLAAGTFSHVETWRLARLCLFQGFLLLPLLGIGPYLLPRFFGAGSSHSFDEALRPPAAWWRKAFASSAAGLGILGSFVLEAWGFAAAGQISRAVLVLAWFALETPVFRRAAQVTTPGTTARWSIIGLAAGLICAALWPFARIGSLHLFFVSGLGMVTMAVGARVILGHAGRHDLLGGRIVWLRWVFGLVLLAATTRMSSDFLPQVRVSHHVYAAWTWSIAALVWLIALAPFLWRDESPAKPKAGCPRRPRRR